jgi:hypothetical protein
MSNFPIVYKVEIEFSPLSGILVDISSRVETVQIMRPRTPPGFGGTATECQITIQNDPIRTSEIGVMTGVTAAHVGYCPFSTEAPTSPWYPNVTRDRRFIITAFWNGGASSKVRMFGWTDTWEPDAGDNPPNTAMISMSGSDVLSRYARRSVFSVFGEFGIVGHPEADYLPFDDAPDSTTLQVYSETLPTTPGRLIQPARIPGSATLQGPDGGHLTDGQMDFTRGGAANEAPAPVVLLPLRSTGPNLQSIEAWYRLTNDPAGALGDDVITGYDASGNRLWVWGPRLVAGNIQWTLYDDAGTALSFYNTGAPRDDGWHYWQIRFDSATTTSIFTADRGQSTPRGFGSGAWSYDPRGAKFLTIGGQMKPSALGKQTNTYQGSVSSILFQYGTAFSYMVFGNPGVTDTADNVATKLNATTTAVGV